MNFNIGWDHESVQPSKILEKYMRMKCVCANPHNQFVLLFIFILTGSQNVWGRALVAACVGLVLLGSILLWMNLQETSDNPEPGGPPKMDLWSAVYNLPKEFGAEGDLSSWPGFIERPMVQEWETLTAEAESAVQFIVSCVAVDFKPDDADSG